jgi:hypothetical protein
MNCAWKSLSLNIPCEELRHCVVFKLGLIIYLQYCHQTTVPWKRDVVGANVLTYDRSDAEMPQVI